MENPLISQKGASFSNEYVKALYGYSHERVDLRLKRLKVYYVAHLECSNDLRFVN